MNILRSIWAWQRKRRHERRAKKRVEEWQQLLAALPTVATDPKKVLLIKVDDIGDFVLFRVFIQPLAVYCTSKGYHLHILVNKAIQALWPTDISHVEPIWLDKNRFWSDTAFKQEVLLQIAHSGFGQVWVPSYSRGLHLEDLLAGSAKGATRTAWLGRSNNAFDFEDEAANQLYGDLRPEEKGMLHEFGRNRMRVGELTESNIGLPSLPLLPSYAPTLVDVPRPNHPYLVLVPVGSTPSKRWPLKSFIELGKQLLAKTKVNIVLVGGLGDIRLVSSLEEGLATRDRVFNLAGKLDLQQLAAVVAEAKLVISNDTAAAHIATAYRVLLITLANGNNYGRFAPTPPEWHLNALTFYPPTFLKVLKQHGPTPYYANRKRWRLGRIPVSKVLRAALEMLESMPPRSTSPR
jgi:ADP-heptose:LPS heptosyltransferase